MGLIVQHRRRNSFVFGGARKCAREAREILMKILIFINHERQLTARAVPYINILVEYNAKFSSRTSFVNRAK